MARVLQSGTKYEEGSDESLNRGKRGQVKVVKGLTEKNRFLSSLFGGSLREQGCASVLRGLPGRADQRGHFSSGITKNDEKK